MARAHLWKASLLMVAMTAIACGGEQPTESHPEDTLTSREDEVTSLNQVLILGRTVSGGLESAEAAAARLAGYSVTVVTDAQWSAMTTEEFSQYRVLVLGDAGCSSLDVVSAARANRHVWGPAVNGNVFIAGTAPVHNGASVVTERAIKFAAVKMGMTGIYISLSCYYQNALPGTPVDLLEPFGAFTVRSGGCYNSAHVVAGHSSLDALTDETLSDWPCSVNAQFDSYPAANFAPFSVALLEGQESLGEEGVRGFADGTYGTPYILTRGARLLGCGDGEQQEGEACDFGNESNGQVGSECSTTCQLNWCGNGVLDAGEECDAGWYNGTAACPKSCQIISAPPPSHRPPVALCKNLTLSAGPFCGSVSASINDGSSDPDGDLVGCVQDVTSFSLGSTIAKVTCTDAQGLTASCHGSVNLQDDMAPTIHCPAASTFECGMGTAQLPPAEVHDNCGAASLDHTMEGEDYSIGAPRVVTWTASDGTHEVACSTSVTMMDTLAPSLTLSGAATQQLECGVGSFNEEGFLASDKCDGDLSARVVISSDVNAAAVGTYAVSYSVGDQAGHGVSATRQVTVADTLAPALALTGASTVALECGVGQYTEAGATAADACMGDVSNRVTITGTVDAATRGSYTVAYSVKDASNNAASATRSVSVSDTLAPSIALVGSSAMRLECGVDGFDNPGATATDACSGNLTGAIVHSGTVNTAAVGSYTVRSEVKDAVGLSASVERTVQVADAKAPVLALKGASTVALECGVGQYTEAGATAADACMGDVSNRISISGTVNAAARGSYTVAYNVSDVSGNAASATRSVSVNDTLAPSIALVGSPTMRLECGVDSFNNPGATAVDLCSGNLTGAIVYSGAVNTAAVGSYTVGSEVKDAAGLVASAVRTVQVADALAPTLTLKGSNPQVVECGVGQYTEAGATAADACTGDVSNRISISGTVNAAKRDSYTVAYNVKDVSNNAASTTRTVNVVDTRAPTLTLLGSASMSITRGSTFTDPGATATDSCSGNLTSAIVKTGTVNTSTAGTYTLTYKVQDGAGLSTTKTRTVTVTAPSCSTTVNVKSTQRIWPPNHKMISFTLSDCASVQTSCPDGGGGGGGCGGGHDLIDEWGTITSIYSDEVEDAGGGGDGNTDDDIVITGPSSFKLRAERQGGGNGRVYGVNFKVTDSVGNVKTATCKFSVPHNQGSNATDNGAAAGYTVQAPAFLAGSGH